VSVYRDSKIPDVGKYAGYFYSGYCFLVKTECNKKGPFIHTKCDLEISTGATRRD
jgi:hypothetical protein